MLNQQTNHLSTAHQRLLVFSSPTIHTIHTKQTGSPNEKGVPPGNRQHLLASNRKGQHAIEIDDQWRIRFRFEDGDAYDVEICNYH